MTTSSATVAAPALLIDRLVPVADARVRTLLHVALGVVALAALAQLRVVVGPVPITGQTLGVLLLAAVLGPVRGTATVAAYLAAGAAGLGVFSGGAAGLAAMGGATAGDLVGFVPAAWLVGTLAARGWARGSLATSAAMVLGHLVIYAFGLAWLSTLAPDLQTALAWGLWPFLLGDALKVGVAAALLPAAWRFARR